MTNDWRERLRRQEVGRVDAGCASKRQGAAAGRAVG